MMVGYGAGFPKLNPKLKEFSLLAPKLNHDPFEDTGWDKTVLSLSQEARGGHWCMFLTKGPLKGPFGFTIFKINIQCQLPIIVVKSNLFVHSQVALLVGTWLQGP